MRCFMSLCPSHKGLPMWSYVIILVSLLPPELLLLVTVSAAMIWLPDHLSWLLLSLLGWILQVINNCGNQSVLFGVNFISVDWDSCIGGFIFLAKLLIYFLLSIWIFQYTLLSIADDSPPLLFPIPPGEIAYVNPILTFISIYFASSYVASSTTPTAAYYAFKSDASAASFYSPRWVDLPSPYIPYWWWMGCW